MISSLLALWTPLAVSPLLWLSLSLLAFVVGQQVQRRCAGAAWANPVLIAIVLMVVVLQATGTGYDTYYAGAQFINFLLGLATVALAVPLALNLSHVRRSLSGVGFPQARWREQALAAGALESLGKPFDGRTLVSLIERAGRLGRGR